jgi:hypothetical protein
MDGAQPYSGVATWPPENSEFNDMVFETLSNLECSFLFFQVEIQDVLKQDKQLPDWPDGL